MTSEDKGFDVCTRCGAEVGEPHDWRKHGALEEKARERGEITSREEGFNGDQAASKQFDKYYRESFPQAVAV